MKELKLGWTKVRALPSSFGRQSKLKSLHLKGSAIERLLSSFNNLTQLQHLDVSYCSKLQTIAELPLSLEILNACYCGSLQSLPELPLSLKTLNVIDSKSLKTVLFPSTAVEQLKENRRMAMFWDCLNLDEHSLVAIGLNAQINVKKFAYQHLSRPNHNGVENYNNYDQNYPSYQAVYGYSGSVPEWLEYKTTKDYIIIDLSAVRPSPLLAFIFCFILCKYQDRPFIVRLEVNITISDDEDEGKMESVKMYIDYQGWAFDSDHVGVMYYQRFSDFLNSRAKNQSRFKIQVTMGVLNYVGTYEVLPQDVLKGFGVSPINTLAYDSFIRQMELHH